MPTYQYTCTECKFEQDQFRMISKRDDPTECLMCGGTAKRDFTPNVNFMGILRLGGATTAKFREEKVREAKQLAADGRALSNAEKADRVARSRGDYGYKRRREAQIDKMSNDLVKFADENKKELTEAASRNKGTMLNPV